MFIAFQERSPRHLDPTASYSLNEVPYMYAVYEPPYAYHYLKRPYVLVPKAATEIATPRYLDKNGKPLPDDAPGDIVAESQYDVHIRPDTLYAPHPAFAKDAKGEYLYHALTEAETRDKHSPHDFAEQRHTRSGCRRLRLCAKASRHSTHRGTDLRHLFRVRHWPEGVRQADPGRRQQAAPGARPGHAGQALSRFPQVPARRCDCGRQTHLSNSDQGQVSAVEVLDDNDIHCACALGGRQVLRPARHGPEQLDAGCMAGRRRTVHGRRVRTRPSPCAGAQPQLQRRRLPLRWHAGRQGGRPACRLRQETPLHRQIGVQHREGQDATACQVHAGLPRCARNRTQRLGPRLPGGCKRL